MRRLAAGAAFVLSAPALAAAGAQPAAIAGKWIAHDDGKMCGLARTSAGGDKVLFAVTLRPGGETSELRFLMPKGWVGPEQPKIVTSLFPAGTRAEATALNFSEPGGGAVVLKAYLDHGFLEQLAQSNRITVAVEGKLVIETGYARAGGAVKALRDCGDQLLRSWGVDTSMLEKLQRKPKPIGSVASWVNASDYPRAALAAGLSGTSVVRVLVGADGRPRNCVIVASSGSADIDRQTCTVTRRGKFEPAIGPDGKPTAAPYISMVNWIIPTG
jgi:TonB family protein